MIFSKFVFFFVLVSQVSYGRTNAVATGLICDRSAGVSYRVYEGEGPGCGQSSKTVIASQKSNWADREIHVETFRTQPAPRRPRCKYHGPIYGGGRIIDRLGTWKVFVDGRFVGSYQLKVKHSGDPHQRTVVRSCDIIDSELDHF